MTQKTSNKAGQATRTAILDAAARLFSMHGYAATSLQDILDSLTLTKGAFYHHFKSKEDLALALLAKAQSEYDTRLFQPVSAEKSPAAKISALLNTVVVLNQEPDWCNCQLMMTLATQASPEENRLRESLRELHAQMLERWAHLLAAGQDAGQVTDSKPPELLAQLILTSFWGSLFARRAELQAIDMKELVKILEGTLLTGS